MRPILSVFTLIAVTAAASGCATGKSIPMTDEQAATCADVGCYLIPKPAMLKLITDTVRLVCGAGEPS